MFQLFEEQEFYNLWETVVPENARLLIGQFRLKEARSDLGWHMPECDIRVYITLPWKWKPEEKDTDQLQLMLL